MVFVGGGAGGNIALASCVCHDGITLCLFFQLLLAQSVFCLLLAAALNTEGEACHQYTVGNGGQNDQNQNGADNGIGQGAQQAVKHCGHVAQVYGTVCDQIGLAVFHAVQTDADFAQNLTFTEGCLYRIVLFFGVNYNVLLQQTQVRIVCQNACDGVFRTQGNGVGIAAQLNGDVQDDGFAFYQFHTGVVGEYPVIQGDGVGIVGVVQLTVDVFGHYTAHDDADGMYVAHLCGGNQTVACCLGVTGLDANGGFVVIALVNGCGGNQTVGVGQTTGVSAFVGCFNGVFDAVTDGHEQLVLHGFLRNQEHIVGSGVVVVVGQTVRVFKVGVHTAQLLCAFVHLCHETGNGAVQVCGNDVGCFVCGCQQGAVQQVLYGEDFTFHNVCGAAVLVHVPVKAGLCGNFFFQCQLATLHSFDGQQRGHDLGQRCGVHTQIALTFVINIACFRVSQINGCGFQIGRGIHCIGRGAENTCQQNKCQQQGKKLEFFHVQLRDNMLKYSWCLYVSKDKYLIYHIIKVISTKINPNRAVGKGAVYENTGCRR